MNSWSCLLPCPTNSPHLLQPPCPSKQCTRLGQQVLWTLPFCWLSPGRLSVPARIRSRAVPSRMHSGLDGLLAAAPDPVGSTVPAGAHRAQVTHCGTRAASHCSWSPVALAGHTHSPGVPCCHHPWASHTTAPAPLWHAARPTGDWTVRHWNEYNLSFNWG